MKIEINLAHPESRLERTLYVWAPVLIVLAFILLIRGLVTTGHEFAQYRAAHRETLRYQAEISEMRGKERQAQAVLKRPPAVKLYQQINFLNGLMERRKTSLSSMTLKISRLLPGQSRLTSLSLAHSEAGPMVQFTIEGSGNAAVYKFLSNIEKSPDFDSVTVTDQAFETQGSDKGLVALTCNARYVGENPERKIAR
ncbi:MAG TPA: PilN domain-containing protein [Terriglobia bacterium]|nr:PilN domain-containing protein [Terriglobia bacterium]